MRLMNIIIHRTYYINMVKSCLIFLKYTTDYILYVHGYVNINLEYYILRE